MTPTPYSPYVGPRAFQKGETLFGRDPEALELQRLIIAERIVLLYSASGAGKTSLVQAKLLPALEAENFRILPPARVSGRHRTDAAENGVNPYMASLISYWETGRPDAETPTLEDLTDIDLDGYLSQRSWLQEDSRMKFLFLDQFEEILTRNPEDQEGKKVFFQQLGNAMKNRDRWVLIAMREEYIAGLDPYLPLLPTRLTARYRLELLGREEASKAVTEPAKSLDVSYDPNALKKLLDELTTVRDASGNSFRIDHVEPLHLQVVCNNLWSRIQEDIQKGMKRIQAKHVSEGADVNTALAAYYREIVQHVSRQPMAQQSGCSERHIRDWFQNELISPQGLRMPLQRSRLATGSLPNPVVKALEDHILVRAELRHSATWYEIAHDRLVAAIKVDNQEWYDSQELEFRTISAAAQKWSELRKSGSDSQAEEKLLSGSALAEARLWASHNSERLNDRDHAFLEACLKHQRDRRRLKMLYFALGLFLLVLAGVLALSRQSAIKKKEELETANRKTAAQRLISDAQRIRYRENNHEQALLLAAQARNFLDMRDASYAEQVMREILQLRPFVLSPEMKTEPKAKLQFSRAAFSPDGKTIAFKTSPNEVGLRSFYPKSREPSFSMLSLKNKILDLGFTPSGRHLVVVTDRSVELFRPSPEASPSPQMSATRTVTTASPPTGPFCLASQDSVLFVATAGGNVEQWSLSGENAEFVGHRGNWDAGFREVNPKITSLTCAPDGRWVAVGSEDGSIAIFQLSQFDLNPPLVKNDFEKWPESVKDELGIYRRYLDFSVTQLTPWEDSTGRDWLVAEFRHGPVGLIRLSGTPEIFYLQPTDASRAELKITAAQGQAVRQIVRKPKLLRAELDPSSSRLVVGGELALIGVWELGTLYEDADAQMPIEKNTKPADSVIFAEYHELRGLSGDITGLAFIPPGRSVAAADSNGNVRIWLRDGLVHSLYRSHPVKIGGQNPGVVWSIAFLPDGNNIVVGGARYLSSLAFSRGQSPGLEPLVSDCLSVSIRSLALSPDKNLLAAATGTFDRVRTCRQHNLPTNTVWVLDISKMVAGNPLPEPVVLDTDRADGLWSLAWSASQNTLAATAYDGKVWIWKRQQGAQSPAFTWMRPESLSSVAAAPARAVAFHPQAPLIAVGRRNGSLEFWAFDDRTDTFAGGRLEQTIEVSRSEVRTVAFSPDGDYLVAGTEDGRIRVFQGRLPHENFKEKSDVLAHPAGVSAIAFRQAAPAGPKPAGIDSVAEEWELASSGNDGNVKIWEWSPSAEGIFRIRERPKWVLMGPTSEALSLSFSPQGDQIAAGDALGNVHLWDLNRESLVKLACSSIRRNLSDQEWKLYIGENIPYERTCPHLP